eukprot:COSAG01_NODE_478_length_16479_cov_45.015629_13_plen_294_part_00
MVLLASPRLALQAGTIAGVYIDKLLPPWMLTMLLTVALIFIASKTARRACDRRLVCTALSMDIACTTGRLTGVWRWPEFSLRWAVCGGVRRADAEGLAERAEPLGAVRTATDFAGGGSGDAETGGGGGGGGGSGGVGRASRPVTIVGSGALDPLAAAEADTTAAQRCVQRLQAAAIAAAADAAGVAMSLSRASISVSACAVIVPRLGHSGTRALGRMALAVGGVIAAASVVQLLARLSGHCGGFLFWLSLFVLTLALIGAGAFKCAASHPHTAALLVCVRVGDIFSLAPVARG